MAHQPDREARMDAHLEMVYEDRFVIEEIDDDFDYLDDEEEDWL